MEVRGGRLQSGRREGEEEKSASEPTYLFLIKALFIILLTQLPSEQLK